MRRIVGSPLTLAQAVTSLYGIGGTVWAASFLGPYAFSAFALISLAQGISIGLQRALLLQPALVQQRDNQHCRTTSIQVLVFNAAFMPVHFALIFAIIRDTGLEVGLVVLASVLPLIHDWLRHRMMADGKQWTVLMSDLVRLSAVATLILSDVEPQNPLTVQLSLVIASTPSVVFLLPLLSRVSGVVRYSSYRTGALWQTAEFGIAQLHTAIPMWIIGVLGASPLIGAFRFAQSGLGPVNLLSSALATNLLVEGTHLKGAAGARRLVQVGVKVAWLVVLVALVAMIALVLFAWFGADTLSGVEKDSLLLAAVCVGLASSASGLAGTHMMVLRVLAYQRLVAQMRGWVVLTVWVGYALGYAVAGVEGSLVVGVSISVVAYPILVLPSARKIYGSL